MSALAAGFTTFVVTFAVLWVVEVIIHRLGHNPSRSYRWGVLVFAVLAGAYEYLLALGR